jgi:TPP-dependent pyruvate/acetoin dehydrogenase alpha subunit
MPGIEHLEAKIAQLEEIMEQLDASKRDARSTLKLLQKERRETEQYMKTIGKEMIEEAVTRLLKQELDIMGPQMREHTNLIYDKIGKETDKLIDLCLGTEFSHRNGREDLRPQLAEKLRIWIKELIRQEGLPIQ